MTELIVRPLPGGPQVRLFQAVPGLYCARIGDDASRKERR